MPENTETTTPEVTTPAGSTPIQSAVVLAQTVGGVTFEMNPKTTAEQVKMPDGTDVATRLLTVERVATGTATNRIVQTIAERDALVGVKEADTCWVIDATGDDTVQNGGAKYLRMSDGTWLKTAEAESMDVILQWQNIVGKPSSTPDDIDLAVAKQHIHSNYEVLTHVNDDGAGNLTYKGKRINDGKVWIARVSSYDDIPSNLADGGLIICDMPAAASGGEEGGEEGEGA